MFETYTLKNFEAIAQNEIKKFTEIGEKVAPKDVFRIIADLTDEVPLTLGVSSNIKFPSKP